MGVPAWGLCSLFVPPLCCGLHPTGENGKCQRFSGGCWWVPESLLSLAAFQFWHLNCWSLRWAFLYDLVYAIWCLHFCCVPSFFVTATPSPALLPLPLHGWLCSHLLGGVIHFFSSPPFHPCLLKGSGTSQQQFSPPRSFIRRASLCMQSCWRSREERPSVSATTVIFCEDKFGNSHYQDPFAAALHGCWQRGGQAVVRQLTSWCRESWARAQGCPAAP